MKRFCFIVCILTLAAACTKTEPQQVAGEYVEIEVSAPDASRTQLYSSQVLWSTGDRIRIFSNTDTSGEIYRLNSGEGTTNGRFLGREVSGATFYATYPETATFDGNTFTYTLPSEVAYEGPTFASGSNPMLAGGSSLNNMVMSNICGALRLELTGAMKIHRMEFTFSNPVCGKGTVGKSGNTLVMVGGEGTKTLTMNFASDVQLDITAPVEICLSLPVGSYTSLSIKTYQKDGNYSVKDVTSSFTITRSQVANMAGQIPSPPVKERPSVKTCSFNLLEQGEDGKYSGHKWSERKSAVYAFLNSEKFDVFCLQECEYRQRKEILSEVSGYAAYGKGTWLGNEKDSGKEWDWDLWEYVYNNEDAANAVFYNENKLTVLDKGTFWLTSDTPSSPAKYSKSKHYHTCSWMKLMYKDNGYQFYVFNTHLENGYNSDGDATRAYEMPIFYNKVNSINTGNLPMLIYGDFNGSTTDIWGYCEASKTGWYWARNQDGKTDKSSYPTSLNDFKSWPAHSGSNVDHIAYKNFYEDLTGGKHGMVKGSFTTYIGNNNADLGYTCPWKSTGVEFISDHWPIAATFVFDYQ